MIAGMTVYAWFCVYALLLVVLLAVAALLQGRGRR